MKGDSPSVPPLDRASRGEQDKDVHSEASQEGVNSCLGYRLWASHFPSLRFPSPHVWSDGFIFLLTIVLPSLEDLSETEISRDNGAA